MPSHGDTVRPCLDGKVPARDALHLPPQHRNHLGAGKRRDHRGLAPGSGFYEASPLGDQLANQPSKKASNGVTMNGITQAP